MEETIQDIDYKKSAIRFAATVAICFVVFKFLLPSYVVRETSMFPTLHDGDRIFLNVFDRTPKKGDIVVFELKESSDFGDVALIKRVVATGGDKCETRNGIFYVNGKSTGKDELKKTREKFTVPKGKFFVMGDNRDESLDSRDFGFVSKDEIKGTLLIRVWPPVKIGGVK